MNHASQTSSNLAQRPGVLVVPWRVLTVALAVVWLDVPIDARATGIAEAFGGANRHAQRGLAAEQGTSGEGAASTLEAAHQPEPHAAEEHAEGAEHEAGVWDTVARLVNFGILAGVLIYFLRSPLASHLRARAQQVTSDLAAAATTQAEAAKQIEAIDRQLAALPGELETLRARGAAEVAAEEARIRQAAEAERQRLLEQARREIDLQLRAAKQELVREAARLATGVAGERIRQNITEGDQLRLVDRYLDQVNVKR